LNEYLQRFGYAIPSMGSISDQTVGGLISTGSHGTGIAYGISSSEVTALDLVTADGRVLSCSETQNREVFRAAACSLGVLGIISTVTIKVEPAFNLEAVQTPVKLDDILGNLDKFVNSAEHFRFWWFPYTDDAVTWGANRTDKKLAPAQESWLRDKFLGHHLLETLLYASSFVPSLLPSLNQGFFNLLFATKTTTVDTSYKVFNFDCLFKQYVSEWAIPM